VLGNYWRPQQVAVPGHRADGQLLAVDQDVVQVGEVVDVDERLGPGQPQLHHRQQGVPAGHQACSVAPPAQQVERVVHARGLLVLEVCWYLHDASRLKTRPRGCGRP
jgi:hypothetical protein